MPAFKPAYLIHGDDHGRIAERRTRLRGLAEAESGPEGVELLEAEIATPEAAAAMVCAMTLAPGRRFVIVDGAERFKDTELAPLESALADMPPETTVAFFAREEGRAKASPKLHDLVRRAGGDVSAESAVKPWELPRWVAARARELGLELDAGAARALVHQVGERQQRLLRELEKLVLDLGPGARAGVDEVEALSASSAERRVWSLADAIVARDAGAATRLLVELRAQGEALARLLPVIAQRLRLAHDVAVRLDAGEPPAQVKRTLRMPAKAAERLIADVRGNDRDGLRRALERLADLEVAARGGSELAEDTQAVRAVQRMAA